MLDFFPFVPPVHFAPPVTQHVPLLSKYLCKNMAHESANNMHPLSWGRGHQRKRSYFSFAFDDDSSQKPLISRGTDLKF